MTKQKNKLKCTKSDFVWQPNGNKFFTLYSLMASMGTNRVAKNNPFAYI